MIYDQNVKNGNRPDKALKDKNGRYRPINVNAEDGLTLNPAVIMQWDKPLSLDELKNVGANGRPDVIFYVNNTNGSFQHVNIDPDLTNISYNDPNNRNECPNAIKIKNVKENIEIDPKYLMNIYLISIGNNFGNSKKQNKKKYIFRRKTEKKYSIEVILYKAFDISLRYKLLNEYNQVKIFGKEFVSNNLDICRMIVQNQESKLKEYLIVIKTKNQVNTLKIKLIFFDNVKKINSIFSQCFSLLSVPDISYWKTNNLTDMSNLFSGCSSLLFLPDISKWCTDKVINMQFMFSGCTSLLILPDISKWNTDNVQSLAGMFHECSSLQYLPDISKWKLRNCIDINSLFNKCSSLINLPNISNWDVRNIKYMGYLFSNCPSLISLPDISKWNTENLLYMNYLFYGCKSLKNLPNISNWKINNVNSLRGLFGYCTSLKEIPNISNWETSNINDTALLFFKCKSLTSLPDFKLENGKK